MGRSVLPYIHRLASLSLSFLLIAYCSTESYSFTAYKHFTASSSPAKLPILLRPNQQTPPTMAPRAPKAESAPCNSPSKYTQRLRAEAKAKHSTPAAAEQRAALKSARENAPLKASRASSSAAAATTATTDSIATRLTKRKRGPTTTEEAEEVKEEQVEVVPTKKQKIADCKQPLKRKRMEDSSVVEEEDSLSEVRQLRSSASAPYKKQKLDDRKQTSKRKRVEEDASVIEEEDTPHKVRQLRSSTSTSKVKMRKKEEGEAVEVVHLSIHCRACHDY